MREILTFFKSCDYPPPAIRVGWSADDLRYVLLDDGLTDLRDKFTDGIESNSKCKLQRSAAVARSQLTQSDYQLQSRAQGFCAECVFLLVLGAN